MRNILLLFLILSGISVLAQEAQESPWKKSADISLTFSQVALTNWAAGGNGSVALNTFGNFGLHYKEGNSDWENKLELAYGLIKPENEILKKSDDRIYFESKYGVKATEKLDYTTLLSFRTQFVEGYNYPEGEEKVYLSNVLAPAYLNLSVGINWKPAEFLSVFLSPASARYLLVNDQILANQGAFGVEPGEKSKFEFGGLAKLNFKKDIFENVNLATNLELFSNYFDKPQNIDILWDVMVFLKINSFLSANITTNLIYDDNIMITDTEGNTGPRVQFKEIAGVGFSYKF
ncbi:MAG: DUF3078 domain-containing protein [Bacteroidia bacterium]|nr:DUF3078 domain-containing protein [Bacteroidia bacterium]